MYAKDFQTITLTPSQVEVYNKIDSLDKKNLYYFVVQQRKGCPNLTLNELKKMIKKSIREWVAEDKINYYQNKENKIVKYFTVFETTKDFNKSQLNNMK